MLRSWLTGGPSPGAGTDNTTVRYYVDGEEIPSIEFKPPMATGAGYDDLTVWGTAKAGHGAKDGAWFINYRIPFQQVCVGVTGVGSGVRACARVTLCVALRVSR